MIKAIEVKTVFAGAIICTLAFTSTQAADVTPAEARVIARDAYIFTYPLALQYHTMYVQAIDSNSREYVGGFGKYRHTSKNKYTITFLPGQLSNYRFFWSITMYGLPERLLVPNPIQRYSIGSNSPDLKIAADGSLVIYLQKDSPGADKEGNWLPAPDSPFSAVLRVYEPGEAEQAGKWKAPALERVK